MTVSTIRKQPCQTPFIDAVARRFNVRVSEEESSLLATYERYWLMTKHLGPIKGRELKRLKYLANKYNSFLRQQL